MGLDATIRTKDKEIVLLRNKWNLHAFISDRFPNLESSSLKCELTRNVLNKIKRDLKYFIKEKERELNHERDSIDLIDLIDMIDLIEAKEIYSKLCILFVKSKHEQYFYEGSF